MLGAKDGITGCCFSGMWAGESNWKEVSSMAGKLIGLIEYKYHTPQTHRCPCPKRTVFLGCMGGNYRRASVRFNRPSKSLLIWRVCDSVTGHI